MGNYACYASRTELKNALSIASSDTTDDARLLTVLEASSRWIDQQCEREFSVRSETRYFTARRADRLMIDDLLALTTLKTDDDSDLDYDDVWTADDYILRPRNRWPKTELRAHPNGDYDFPAGLVDGVEVVGLWGYGDGESATPYEDSSADTAEVLDASETGIDVTDGTALAVGQTILVESEQMYVIAIASNTLTVRRGVNGTTAATHATAKDVYIYRYPATIVEATILRAAQLFYGMSAPLNIMGAASGQQGVFTPQMLYARIMDLLSKSRRITVG